MEVNEDRPSKFRRHNGLLEIPEVGKLRVTP
jgi:hypothetical protein